MMDPIDYPVSTSTDSAEGPTQPRQDNPPPLKHRPRIDGYRVFMTAVFCGVVAVDAWADRTLSPLVSGDVVGPLSVVLWLLTLLGSAGIGPMGHLKSAMRW